MMEIGRKNSFAMPLPVTGGGIALCTIGRLENRYAREYVEHYRFLGFDKIIICDNNRGDEEHFEDVLRDYIDDGFVDILDYRDRDSVQRKSYEDVYRRYGKKFQWIAFFDFDEYLEIVSGNDIHALMPSYTGYDCVLFNWMNYGDNGLLRDDGRKLSERFSEPLPFDQYVQYSDIPDNNHVKCIVRGGLKDVRFEYNPHLPSNVMRCCTSSCDPCSQHPFQRQDYSVAYIKHYATKTVEEWYSDKWKKGTGNQPYGDFRGSYAGRFFLYNEWTLEKESIMREITGLKPRIVPNHRNVLIVNFNTQSLTDAAIRSLNKQTPGCKVFVFDNSDKVPYVNTFANVEVIDNTKGQHIDFDKMLSEYPDKYPTPENSWGSAKHCKTIDYCFELFPDGFLLMDSDMLVKKDISTFFDNSCVFVGNVELCRSKFNVNLFRALPYLCYINVRMCLEHNVRYFNGEKMFALSHRTPDMAYDTGCWFYEDCERKNLPVNYIRISDYAIHLRHGSWIKSAESDWLQEYRYLWE